jgi:methyltransferase (TIGR00027 family)
MEAEPSRTAMMAAFARERHRLDPPPCVLDDPFARDLVGPAWEQIAALADALFSPDLQRRLWAGVVGRARYAEDRLTGRAFTQCVLLGAGLDSLAWRHPEFLGDLTLFEVDHPASQAWKRERVTELRLPLADRHVFVPIDFEVESLRTGLDKAGFDWAAPTLFSWMGVTPYLTTDAVEATLRTIATCAPGSEVAFSYRADESVLDDDTREIVRIFEPLTVELGEPVRPGQSAEEMEQLVAACGLKVADHPAFPDFVSRYFAGRTDGLLPWTLECLLVAAVP